MVIEPDIELPDPGPYVLGTHWSLTTLQRWFAPHDVATVVREPASRLLSYALFARTLGQDQHRFWYPDDLGAQLVRLPLIELLEWEPATRAIDNLIVRQVMWGDERIVTDRYLGGAATALGHDAAGRIRQLGFVGVIEAASHAIDGLSKWLGEPIAPRRDNVTPTRGSGGLLRRRADVELARQLLSDRTIGDRLVWEAVAADFDVDPEACDRRLGERLLGLCDSAFMVGWQPGTRAPGRAEGQPSTGPGPLALPDRASVIAYGLDPVHDGSDIDSLAVSGAETVTIVTDRPHERLATAADVVALLPDPPTMSLHDVLIGRDADAIMLGRRALANGDSAERLRQLTDCMVPGAPVLLTREPDEATAADLRRVADELGHPLRILNAEPTGHTRSGFDTIRAGLARVVRVARRSLNRLRR